MGVPPRHAHGDLTSLAPHERLTEILVVPRENPRDGGAWWAAVSGVAQSRTRLKRLSSSSSSSSGTPTPNPTP